MKILLLSRYTRRGASSRLRSYQYLPLLREKGIHVDTAPLFDDGYLKSLYSGKKTSLTSIVRAYLQRIRQLRKLNEYELLWIEYELFPWLPAYVEKLFLSWEVPYIVDYDDAIFHRYDAHSRTLVRMLLGKKIDTVMSGSILVLAGNDYLLNRAKQAGATCVELLPTVIDLDRYVMKEKSPSNKFTIGWIGSPTTSIYLENLQPVLSELCRDQNTVFTVIGAKADGLTGLRLQTKNWSEQTEVADVQQFDVGIMPLPDTLWSKGKCGYKLIQYMACGCPVVASNIGANKEIVRHGINGFLTSSRQDWFDCLKALRDDPELRNRLGSNGRRTVEEKYCLQVTAPRLVGLVQHLQQGLQKK